MSHWASLSQRGKGSPDVATMVLASCGRARCLMSFGSRHSDITLSLPSIGSGERDGNTVALVITSGAQVHRLTVPVLVLIGPTVGIHVDTLVTVRRGTHLTAIEANEREHLHREWFRSQSVPGSARSLTPSFRSSSISHPVPKHILYPRETYKAFQSS